MSTPKRANLFSEPNPPAKRRKIIDDEDKLPPYPSIEEFSPEVKALIQLRDDYFAGKISTITEEEREKIKLAMHICTISDGKLVPYPFVEFWPGGTIFRRAYNEWKDRPRSELVKKVKEILERGRFILDEEEDQTFFILIWILQRLPVERFLDLHELKDEEPEKYVVGPHGPTSEFIDIMSGKKEWDGKDFRMFELSLEAHIFHTITFDENDEITVDIDPFQYLRGSVPVSVGYYNEKYNNFFHWTRDIENFSHVQLLNEYVLLANLLPKERCDGQRPSIPRLFFIEARLKNRPWKFFMNVEENLK